MGGATAQSEAAKKFRSSLFKGLSEPPRSAVAPRKARNSLSFKAPRGVNFKSLWAFERGEHTSGGSPFYTKAILIVCPLFSLAQEAQEKSLAKKKRRRKCFAACARRPTLRALDWRSLFGKSDVKTFIRFALNRSTNQNLKFQTSLDSMIYTEPFLTVISAAFLTISFETAN